MTDTVLLEIKGPIANITLNKPERLNALDVPMWEAIAKAAAAVDGAPEVRVAILMGAGGAFCAGLDVKAGSTLTDLGLDGSPAMAIPAVRRHLAHLQACFSRLEACRVPVIGALERVCIGGGLELALCCDIRLAAEGTIFAIPEVQLGIVPDMGGTQRLPRTIGIGLAKELIYSARRIDAAAALRIGLVNAVYPAGELAARVAELAAEISGNAPLAVQAAKRSINGTYWRELGAWLDQEAAEAAGPLLSDDRKHGMRAAAERRRADFTGR
ncbi:MAG TPA: enoyl-CoA hydratase/isomerase family protein [Candidatus Methylomirabilis sp.]|nr:enoyl-CoA hydratase/isomerase family protein [Candidatus Methylomirabilis sp.]